MNSQEYNFSYSSDKFVVRVHEFGHPTVYELVKSFKRYLVACGFSEDVIKDAFKDPVKDAIAQQPTSKIGEMLKEKIKEHQRHYDLNYCNNEYFGG